MTRRRITSRDPRDGQTRSLPFTARRRPSEIRRPDTALARPRSEEVRSADTLRRRISQERENCGRIDRWTLNQGNSIPSAKTIVAWRMWPCAGHAGNEGISVQQKRGGSFALVRADVHLREEGVRSLVLSAWACAGEGNCPSGEETSLVLAAPTQIQISARKESPGRGTSIWSSRQHRPPPQPRKRYFSMRQGRR